MNLKNPVIITTKQNICGRNIRETLLQGWVWEETGELFDGTPILKHKNIRLVFSGKDVIESDHCDQLNADLLLFGSRHKSEANKPSLLTHVTGNLGADNSHGGNPFELAYGSCRAIRESYLHLKVYQNELELPDFDVTVEATHHGPTSMKTPLIYIEVGSTEIEYQNTNALLAVAKTIMDICLQKENPEIIPSICFGGGHYTTRFNEIMDLTPVAISHILPKYHKNNLTINIVEQMIDKTVEKVKWAIIDRNSLNADLIKIIEDGCSTRDVEVVKARDIKYDNITKEK
ncbi:MAG TPA: D-aminoacyl-tRNA deacylase [Candidatus Bathyarchaeia archaeon]|nr:D-aminoacyl-tRNA deacylase [Candidatus Bathyarchaeia archaeon]